MAEGSSPDDDDDDDDEKLFLGSLRASRAIKKARNSKSIIWPMSPNQPKPQIMFLIGSQSQYCVRRTLDRTGLEFRRVAE